MKACDFSRAPQFCTSSAASNESLHSIVDTSSAQSLPPCALTPLFGPCLCVLRPLADLFSLLPPQLVLEKSQVRGWPCVPAGLWHPRPLQPPLARTAAQNAAQPCRPAEAWGMCPAQAEASPMPACTNPSCPSMSRSLRWGPAMACRMRRRWARIGVFQGPAR